MNTRKILEAVQKQEMSVAKALELMGKDPYYEQTAPQGLVEELREEMKRNSDATTGAIQCWMIDEILSRYEARKEVEPLAVLADRKGIASIVILPPT